MPGPAGTAASATSWASGGVTARPASGPGHEPAGVGVDEPDVVLEREDQHGAGRVRADAGQGEQGVERVGDAAAVALDDQPPRTGAG